jgi:hypothetical protein
MLNIEISQENYDQLIEDSLMLAALMEAGVNNWEGYELAKEIYRAWMDE